MLKHKPTSGSGIFYEIGSEYTKFFMSLVQPSYEIVSTKRHIGILEWQGTKYMAASDGAIAVYYPVDDSMDCGDYEGLPYMLNTVGTFHESLKNLLFISKDFPVYCYTDRSSNNDGFEIDIVSEATVHGKPVLLCKIIDGEFVINDSEPYTWIINQEKFNFLLDALGGFINGISANGPDQHIEFHNTVSGAMAILMPMRPDATVMINGVSK